MLIDNPTACTGCPFNPYDGTVGNDNGILHIAYEQWSWLLDDAFELDALMQLRPDLASSLTSQQFAALSALRQARSQEETLLLGRVVSEVVSKSLEALLQSLLGKS